MEVKTTRLAVLTVLAIAVGFLSGFCSGEPVRKPVQKEIVFADALFTVFDPHAKDVFVFVGAITPRQPGQVVGIDRDGKEVRIVVVQGGASPPTNQTPPISTVPPAPTLKTPTPKIDATKGEPIVAQPKIESPPKQVSQTAPRFASLKASCAECHTRGVKERGGFVLFDQSGALFENVEWKDVLAEIESGRMPPADSKKPKVSTADVEAVRQSVKK